MEGQSTQKVLMEATKDNQEFEAMKRHEQKNNTFNRVRLGRIRLSLPVNTVETCMSRRYLAYTKRCSQCDKANH